MKKSMSIPIGLILIILILAALPVLAAQGNKINQTNNTWFWQVTHTVEQAWNANEQVVVVEGKIGDPVPPAAWLPAAGVVIPAVKAPQGWGWPECFQCSF